jgi:hypothetical protein
MTILRAEENIVVAWAPRRLSITAGALARGRRFEVVLSISSLALPTASAGSSAITRWIRPSCSLIALGSFSPASDPAANCGPAEVMCPVSESVT